MTKKIRSILIANRGEIARRIVRTAKHAGIKTIQLYSDHDEKNSFIFDADEQHLLTGDTVAETYLNIDQILKVAKIYAVDAIHPGYGFLSESSEFAARCQQEKIIFIGPSPEVLALTGDKRAAKKLAKDNKVPTLESLSIASFDEVLAKKFADDHGLPLIIKAAYGGGGRGMRIVSDLRQAKEFCERAAEEAKKFFASSEIFIEPYIEKARHIEVQFIGDNNGVIKTLGTRDCSMQRNHQKVLEEAPAPGLSPGILAQLEKYTTTLATAAHYQSAGTAEYLVTDFAVYFLEINARIQVEHPVTEAIWGVDLILMQIKIAEAQSIDGIWNALGSPSMNGAAIEARICAENSRANFAANTGRLLMVATNTEGDDTTTRFDFGFQTGDTISHQFDSMIGKVICTGETRSDAINTLMARLSQLEVVGVPINTEFLLSILSEQDFHDLKRNALATSLLGSKKVWGCSDQLIQALYVGSCLAAAARANVHPEQTTTGYEHTAFRIFGQDTRPVTFEHQGKLHRATVTYLSTTSFTIEGNIFSITPSPDATPHTPTDVYILYQDSKVLTVFSVQITKHEHYLHSSFGQFVFVNECGVYAAQKGSNNLDTSSGVVELQCPLPGAIASVPVQLGQQVSRGQTVLLLESMKMEHEINAPFSGEIISLSVVKGAQVKKGDVLATIKRTAIV